MTIEQELNKETDEYYNIVKGINKDVKEKDAAMITLEQLRIFTSGIKIMLDRRFQKEFERHTDQSYQRGYNKGCEETIKKVKSNILRLLDVQCENTKTSNFDYKTANKLRADVIKEFEELERDK